MKKRKKKAVKTKKVGFFKRLFGGLFAKKKKRVVKTKAKRRTRRCAKRTKAPISLGLEEKPLNVKSASTSGQKPTPKKREKRATTPSVTDLPGNSDLI